MRAIIAAKLLASRAAQPAAKPFEIYDSRLRGFTLRVQPSGARSYYARLGRSRRVALGFETGDVGLTGGEVNSSAKGWAASFVGSWRTKFMSTCG